MYLLDDYHSGVCYLRLSRNNQFFCVNTSYSQLDSMSDGKKFKLKRLSISVFFLLKDGMVTASTQAEHRW